MHAGERRFCGAVRRVSSLNERKGKTVNIFFSAASWLGDVLTFISDMFVHMFQFLLHTS